MNTGINTATECLRTLPIERAHGLTPEVFQKRFLTDAGKPVIVTDAMNSWGATFPVELRLVQSPLWRGQRRAQGFYGCEARQVDEAERFSGLPRRAGRASGVVCGSIPRRCTHARLPLNPVRLPYIWPGMYLACTPNCLKTSN